MPGIYGRQELMEGLKIPDTVCVVGLGGTGFWAAYFLAMSGVKNLIVVDADVIEETNFNRLPLEEGYKGWAKVNCLYEKIIHIRPDVRIEVHEIKLIKPEDCIILRDGPVFCCTDNIQSQQLICAYCRKNGLPYQRIGYDGDTLNVSNAFPMTFDDNLPGGYDIVPSQVCPAAAAAAIGVWSQLNGKGNIVITESMSELCTKNSTVIPQHITKKLEKNTINKVVADPNFYGIEVDNDCDGCDRGDCNNCDYRNPNDTIIEIAHEIENEEAGKRITDAIDKKYISWVEVEKNYMALRDIPNYYILRSEVEKNYVPKAEMFLFNKPVVEGDKVEPV
jgi:molybdopterin/thiamine biosynthesis adenylyltransferase